MDQDYPQFLRADRAIKEKYLDALVAKDSGTCFAGQELGEVYILAAAMGCASGKRIKSGKTIDVRTYAKLNPDYKVLIRAMALHASKTKDSYDYEVAFDGKKVLGIVEEFANAGIEILYKKIFEGGNLNLSINTEVSALLGQLQEPAEAA